MPQTLNDIKKLFHKELESLYDEQERGMIFQIIADHVLHYNRVDIIMHSQDVLEEQVIKTLSDCLRRLSNSEPVQYITGRTDFYDLTFVVTPAVLIPRQETEILIDWLVKEHKNRPAINILDIGTGSGCIAVATKKNLPACCVSALDISKQALEVAKKNALLNHVQIQFIEMDIFKPEPLTNRPFDLIVSNPPYVRMAERQRMHNNVLDFEPAIALFVEDNNPLVYYNAIFDFCRIALGDFGRLAFEINEHFGREIEELFLKNGFTDVQIIQDLNYKDRFVTGIKSGIANR
jgi:release factor glutamine methyltransferase